MPNAQPDFKIVKFQQGHVDKLKEFSDLLGKNTYPDITDKLVFARCSVVDSKGEVIGGAFLRTTVEATIYLDPKMSLYRRARIIDELFKVGKQAARVKEVNELHVFLFQMKSFGNYLVKKLGFDRLNCDTFCVRF